MKRIVPETKLFIVDFQRKKRKKTYVIDNTKQVIGPKEIQFIEKEVEKANLPRGFFNFWEM